MVSELQRVNETLLEEHTALQQHVGSLEGEMTAMRADLQALRIDLSRGGDDRILGKIGNKAGGRTNDADDQAAAEAGKATNESRTGPRWETRPVCVPCSRGGTVLQGSALQPAAARQREP